MADDDTNDWSSLPVDPSTGRPVITVTPQQVNPLPVQPLSGPVQPDPAPTYDPGTGTPYPTSPPVMDTDQMTGPLAKLLGTAGNDRYKLWPEKVAESAATLAHDVIAGNVLTGPGLRRQDFTDIPPPDKPTKDSTSLAQLLNLPPTVWEPLDPLIERSQDMAAIAGGAPLIESPGVASLGSGMVRQMATNENAPVFYSAVENAIKNAKQTIATPEQWLGYLKNQPGVKQEELDWTLGDLPTGDKLTKQQVEDHIAANKVQLQEVNKGQSLTPDEINRMNNADPGSEEYNELANKATGNLNKTKYSQWQLPGGDNYKEMLLTLPATIAEQLPKGYKVEQILDGPQKGLWQVYNNKGYKTGFASKTQQEAISDVMGSSVINAPKTNVFTSSHWDEPNPVAHVRMNDRNVPNDTGYRITNLKSGNTSKTFDTYDEALTYANGLPENIKNNIQINEGMKPPIKTLHLEEIQSDWHQKGRELGYKLTDDQQKELDRIDKKLVESGADHILGEPDMSKALKMAVEDKILSPDEAKNYAEYSKSSDQSVPDAPFKKSWPDLVLKRMIRHASENGYDAISWTPGEAQAARYDLSKQISKIEYSPENKHLMAYDKNNKQIMNKLDVKPEDLPNHIGKEAADKILNNPSFKKEMRPDVVAPVNTYHALQGMDLKIGGEGMKAFYDKMLVDKANALAKKFGGKVEGKNIPSTEKGKVVKISDNQYVIQHNSGHSKSYKTKEEAEAELNQPIHFLKLPQELKDTALQKGFPLFTGGTMVTPVQGNPFANSSVNVGNQTIPVNDKQDVPYGAGASKTHDGLPVNIDKRIPRTDPKLLDSSGQPADLHKYLAIHELTEYPEMERLIASGMPKEKAYLQAHYHAATPAERAAVEADGVNWQEYSKIIDGYLKDTEHENPKNVPNNLYTKPYNHNELRKMKLMRVSHNPFE